MKKMKIRQILGALTTCALLAFAAGAPASERDATQAVEKREAARKAAGPAAADPDSGAKAGRAAEPAVPASPGKGSVSTPRGAEPAVAPHRGAFTPRRGPGQTAQSNADRLHPQLTSQARGRLARRSGELPESVRAATGGADARAPRGATPTGTTMVATPAGATPTVATPAGVTPAGQPNLAASTRAVPAAAPRLVIPRDSAIGGPHAQGQGRVGGPATRRTTHGGTIDGTQLRHKS